MLDRNAVELPRFARALLPSVFVAFVAFVAFVSFVVFFAALPASVAEGQDHDAGMDEEARALFVAGRTAFSEGRFENALEYFQRSYELSGKPELLFNIGVSADRLRRDDLALESFRGYLEAMPEPPNRAEVEGRIEVLERRTAESSDGTGTPEESASEPSGGAGAGVIVAIASGAAALVAGGVLLGLAVADQSAVQGAPVGSDWAEYEDQAARVPILSGVGFAALGVGAALLATGVVLWVSGGGDDAEEGPSVAVGPGSVMLRGRW